MEHMREAYAMALTLETSQKVFSKVKPFKEIWHGFPVYLGVFCPEIVFCLGVDREKARAGTVRSYIADLGLPSAAFARLVTTEV